MPRIALIAALIGLPSLVAPVLAANAAGPFAPLGGSWSGAGSVRLEGGRSEGLRCKAYYSPKNGGAQLGLSLRCASASNKFELRANLTSRGNRVSGSWEERSYSVSGAAYGVASGSSLRLSINGGGLAGTMSVTTSGRSQSISVRTDGAALRGINISLRRD